MGENSRKYPRMIPFITVNIAPKNGLVRVLLEHQSTTTGVLLSIMPTSKDQ